MKKLIFSLIATVLFLNISTAQRGEKPTGFDGDNFSLEGALEIFKQSNSIKDFERNLNTRDRYVNNLDLNFDGRIDYIRVEHKKRGNYHAVILQVPINRREVQDIAVIEIEKTGRRTAMLQIIGDEYLYGNEVIVEPIARGGDSYRNGVVNVYKWNTVRHILRRSYNPWVSPYRYSYYPTWWSPWRQYAYYDFYPRTVVYRDYYGFVTIHRVYRVHNFYRPYRVYCPAVVTRSNRVHVINGTTRRPAVNKPNRRNVAKTTPRVRNNKTQTTRRQTSTSPTRQATTTRPTRVNKKQTSSPTRATSKTRVNRNTKSTNRSRVTRSTKSNNRSSISTTPRRSNTSSVRKNTSSVSKPSTASKTPKRATTSAKRSTSRVSTSKKSTRRN